METGYIRFIVANEPQIFDIKKMKKKPSKDLIKLYEKNKKRNVISEINSGIPHLRSQPVDNTRKDIKKKQEIMKQYKKQIDNFFNDKIEAFEAWKLRVLNKETDKRFDFSKNGNEIKFEDYVKNIDLKKLPSYNKQELNAEFWDKKERNQFNDMEFLKKHADKYKVQKRR